MPDTPPAKAFGTWLWDALVAPSPAVTDRNERQRLRTIAAIALPLGAFAILGVLTAPQEGRIVGLGVVAMLAGAYALARTAWWGPAPFVLTLSASVVPYYGMLTPEATTRSMDEQSWALLLPIIAAFVLPTAWVLPIGWGHVVLLGLISLNNPGIPAEAAWQMIATNTLVTLLAVVAAWSRDAQEGAIEERDRNLSSALDDLARARALSESTIAAMADGLLVADGGRRIRSANPALCRALGYEETELLGKPLDFVLVDDHADTQIFEAPLAAESMLSQESLDASFRTRAGDEIPMSCKVTWLNAPGQLDFGLVVLARDMRAIVRTIEARAEAEAHRRKADEIREAHDQLLHTQAQLVQAGKLAALGELAGAVAHEVNNPLAAALLATDLAEECLGDRPDDGPVRAQLEVIHEAIDRCRHVINGLLDFGRQSSGTREMVDLRGVVDSSLTLISRKLAATGSTVEVDIPEAMNVWGDRNQLGQVVLNLLMNASQAAEGPSVIRVTGSSAHGEVRLTVRDTGQGIAPGVLRKIFEPFFTTKPRGQGTGLGLSISYGIVTDHDGRIDVASRVGEGSSFTVILPEATSGVPV